MSIIITNVSKNSDLSSLNDYIVRINEREICRFQHIRKDGLAECLRKAADAIDVRENTP